MSHERIVLFLTNFLNALTVLPHICLDYTILAQNTRTVLLPVDPRSLVVATIWPSECSKAMLPILDVLAIIAPSIGPLQLTVAVHFVLEPGTSVVSTVLPAVHALACDIVGDKLAAVVVSVGPTERSMPILVTLLVLANKFASIRPDFEAGPILQIVEPVAGITRTIGLKQATIAVSFVSTPFTLVYVTASVN